MFKIPTHNRVIVWEQTLNFYKDSASQQSQVIQGFSEQRYYAGKEKYDSTNIQLVRDDCIYAAVNLVNQGHNPLLLNMASWVQPGGGVRNGAGSQEEDLFRRSNYHKFLTKDMYPQKRLQAILSKKVEFSRKGRDVGYTSMPTPILLDCVASPCLKNPTLRNNRFTQEDVLYMKTKIRQLFQIAYDNGNDSLVLSAWGCGAFHCPPEHMGELFAEIVLENLGFFKTICFAIIDNNYEPFHRGFYSVYNRI